MLPDPLHPAIVHMPMALAVILPVATVAGFAVIRLAWLPVHAWSVIVLLAGLLVVSAWVAHETGEHEEERVERVVAERWIERHEEAADTFSAVAIVCLFTAAAGLLAGRTGELARGATVLLAFGVLAAGIQVGRLGGELVYEHGAAAAYGAGSTVPASTRGDEHEHD